MVISGWKGIAKYLGCGVRTAQRWARTSGLPIHRPVQLRKRGPVIALSENLDKWVQKGRVDPKPPSDLISRHLRIIEELRQNLEEQTRLLNKLRNTRIREAQVRHPK